MISIVIPTLNEERVLGGLLRELKTSLRDMPHEVIVSDAGSTDQTVEVARPFADVILRHRGDWRPTISETRNAGAAAAKGQYLVFFDADVTLPAPDWFFGVALSFFERDEKLVGITSYVRVLPQLETIADRVILGALNWQHVILNNWLHCARASGKFQMMGSAAFRATGGFDERLVAAEDYDLFARLGRLGSTYCSGSLCVFHTGRRPHAWGWPKLLYWWWANEVSRVVRGKSVSKVWEPVR